MKNLKNILITSLTLEFLILFIQFLNVQLSLNLLDFLLPLIIINTIMLLIVSIISLVKKQNLTLSIISLILSLFMILIFYLLIQALKTFT